MKVKNNNILKTFVFVFILTLVFGVSSFAAVLDPTIPKFSADNLSLSPDGTASFEVPAYSGGWKRFDVQLLKRVTTVNPSNSVVSYTYKTQGSIKQVDPSDRSYSFTISSVGYYQFQIRGVNLEGNYGDWVAIYDNATWSSKKTEYPGVSVDEDDISAGGGSHTGGIGYGNDYYYGPGVINNYMNPYGYQNYYYGPNGEIIYNNPYQQNPYQQPNNYYYPNNNSNYPQVPAPYANNQYGYNQYGYNQYGYNTNGMTNPNYYNGGNNTGNNSQGNNNYNPTNTPQITQGLEIGWHVDNNGRFYYQGNGVVLKGTWYFIDGSFYRFSDSGYTLANQWFRDNTTGYWYYLGGDGRMFTGWQLINGVWYYFKPENGNGYGTMYMNTSLQINDPQYGSGVYAFDSNGVMVKNAWFGGYYYGSDGRRS